MKQKLILHTLILLLILPLPACVRRGRDPGRKRARTEVAVSRREQPQKSNIVKMRKDGGVYHIPCKINGTEMEFIFDTGASDITMSLTEALFLYKHGKLSEDDFIGAQQYQIADGSIREGMVVVLRNVEIGNRKLTGVQASIMDNMEAPLLLGQSALAKFGEISINYNKNEITFK
jgi:aspartyl protease family protein